MSSTQVEGDPEHGKKVFMKICSHCHTIEPHGRHIFGPNLWNVYGKKSGQVEDYGHYSDAHKAANLTWDKKQLDSYLEDPYKTIPGTKKHYHGLKNAKERADVIAYLEKN